MRPSVFEPLEQQDPFFVIGQVGRATGASISPSRIGMIFLLNSGWYSVVYFDGLGGCKAGADLVFQIDEHCSRCCVCCGREMMLCCFRSTIKRFHKR